MKSNNNNLQLLSHFLQASLQVLTALHQVFDIIDVVEEYMQEFHEFV